MGNPFTGEQLPNRFDHATSLPKIYAAWERAGYFHAEPEPEREPFTIVIPPPNVTGALHLGHALNNTLQDSLIRFKRMQGFNTLWMPGTDHAGIATQAVVERRLKEEQNLTRHDLGREQLVERIWEWKDQYEQRILDQLKRMGCSCDWDRTRFTLDDTCARAVRYTFFDLFRKDLIYRGKRLVNWDTFLQTAVSDDEVFHETVKGHFWHILYPVVNPKPGEPSHVTIATTRPETLLGDTAVAVHPDPAAALELVETELNERLAQAASKERESLEQQRAQLQQRRAEMLGPLEQLRDMANDGRMLMLPLLNREIPLVTDPWAKPELGSGCVKITPAHDPNDYEVGQRVGLPMINILNPNGTMNSAAGPYAGLTIKQARKQVVADLEDLKLVPQIEDREIDLAHSDRSKTPIEPYLADQWFVRMDQLAQSAMDAVSDGRVKIIPARYAKGYLDWLSEKRDWPVSRQLWWGHQIPIWSVACMTEAELDQRLTELKSDDHIASGEATFQVERVAAADADGAPLAYVHVCVEDELAEVEEHYEALGYIREEDVLDTWFSSALWPHSTLGWPEQNAALDYFYPTQTLITSRDIITLWVARMVLMGLNNVGDVPFREVFIHPKILDGYGETMSKSKGNGVDPLDVIDKFGADALRFGLAHLTTETQDVRMPVQFECPHCDALIDQTKKNRELPKVVCPKCNQAFRTQWAKLAEDLALPRGAVVSERFEVARNFCNKLWNASRFVLMNLEGYQPGTVKPEELAFEDKWLLSRLVTVAQSVAEAFDEYRYAEAARVLYEFAWEDFCSFYIEMTKDRLQDPAQQVTAQRVVAYALDVLLRLLHPIMPFITEEVWGLLGQVVPQRGLAALEDPSESIMVAPWPELDRAYQSERIERQFSRFQALLGALREIRSRQGIAPKQEVSFCVRCGDEVTSLLQPMEVYFQSMASAVSTGWGNVEPPRINASIRLDDLELFVDLAGLIDVEAETARLEKQRERLTKSVEGKRKKLANEGFVARAPEEVVQREREGLAKMEEELAAVEKGLSELRTLDSNDDV